jgi:hypothetical protein
VRSRPFVLAASLALAGLVPIAPLRAQSVPTPESVLGFKPGADFHLATYEQSIAYFKKLDEASDRLTLVRVGRTSEGRDWYIALISSAKNLANIDRIKAISERLAHPEGLSDDSARALAREGRAIVDISGGLHASEVAGAQHTIQLAYDLVTRADSDRTMRAILDNVVLVLWPSINPDGQTIVADWYASNVGGPYETAPMPWLYQKYVGHDNNRDAYMLDMHESRVVERTWREWEPQIIHVHHQSSPTPTRIWLPPFAEPIAPRVPPLMSRTVNTIGMAIAQMLEERGMPGATHMGTGFDAWSPGYLDYMPNLQNEAAFWTETAGYRYATPHFYTLSEFPRDMRDERPRSLYSSPWKGGWWRLADAVDYMRVASLAVLDYAAKYREDLLWDRYESGERVIAQFRKDGPFAYFVPREQRDPVAPVEFLRRLAFAGVKIDQLTSQVTHEGVTYPAGTWVVPLDQEFGELARQVLEVQHYPDLRQYPDGPPEQPYDAAGWTLPYQMGVHVVEATQPLEASVREAMRPVEGKAIAWDADVADAAPFDMVPGVGFDSNPVAAGIVPLPGRVTGSGSALVLDPAENNSFKALNEAWNAGAHVRFSHGRYEVTGLSGARADRLVRDLALQARRADGRGTPLERPRLGLYRPWTASMDEGWTRFLLERYAFPYDTVRDADLRAGDLRDRYDVLVLPSERPSSLLNGFERGTVPPRYAGGMGEEGVRAIEAFVRAGGTLVCTNEASDLCIDQLHLPVRNMVRGLKSAEFFSDGSILQVHVDTAHPVMAGMPAEGKIFYDASPVFTTEDGFQGSVLAMYAKEGSPLLSGYLLGEKHLQGYAAAVDARLGDGHVVLLGFRPQWRGQPFGTFRVLFNAVLFHGAVARAAKGTEGFWTAPAEVEPADRGGAAPSGRM